jgi:hypothetical protein
MVHALRTLAVIAVVALAAGTTVADSGLASGRGSQKAEPSQADQLKARKARADRLALRRLLELTLQASRSDIWLDGITVWNSDARAPGP